MWTASTIVRAVPRRAVPRWPATGRRRGAVRHGANPLPGAEQQRHGVRRRDWWESGAALQAFCTTHIRHTRTYACAHTHPPTTQTDTPAHLLIIIIIIQLSPSSKKLHIKLFFADEFSALKSLVLKSTHRIFLHKPRCQVELFSGTPPGGLH